MKITLKSKFILYSIMLFIPLTLFIYYLIVQSIEQTKDEIIKGTLNTAEIVRSNVDIFLDDTTRLLLTLSSLSTLRDMDGEETMSLFVDTLRIHPGIINLYATDRDGNIYAATAWRGDDPKTIYHNKEFQTVLQTNEPFLSRRITSRSTGEMALSVMVPVQGEGGDTLGVIGAELSVGALQDHIFIKDRDLDRIMQIAITDEDGIVLVHSKYSYVYHETSYVNLYPYQQAIQGNQGIDMFQDPNNGDWRWGAYQPTNSFAGAVIVSVPDAFMQPILWKTMMRWFRSLFLVMILVIGFSVYFSGLITKPLQKMTAFTRDLDLNNLQQKMEITTKDELGELSNAFNLMTDRLSENMQSLAIANQEVARQKEKLRELFSSLVYAQEEERTRIAADIHDGITQMVTGALYETKAAINLLESSTNTGPARSGLGRTMDLLSDTIVEMQRIIQKLRPTMLEDMGIISALRLQAAKIAEIHKVPINLHVLGKPIKLDPIVEVIIYRIIQESMHNAIKHSDASLIHLECCYRESNLVISVKDDGVGFDFHNLSRKSLQGMGLLFMEERANSIGATLAINSQVGKGTEVILQVAAS